MFLPKIQKNQQFFKNSKKCSSKSENVIKMSIYAFSTLKLHFGTFRNISRVQQLNTPLCRLKMFLPKISKISKFSKNKKNAVLGQRTCLSMLSQHWILFWDWKGSQNKRSRFILHLWYRVFHAKCNIKNRHNFASGKAKKIPKAVLESSWIAIFYRAKIQTVRCCFLYAI